ncbi:unnamed protein product [Adineta steineri]|uniref:Replication protein A 70 kDa DNA-binding subunit n=1 Tax=Adineta steineri TaxID=433720 RepID=A0A819MRM1_9BILA|nr:unnamed protein product [Adineta steineri]
MNVDQIQLSTNAITECLDGKACTKAILQITNLKLINNAQGDTNDSSCYRLTISDGITTYSSCILNTTLNKLVDSGELKENTIICIKEIMIDFLEDQTNRTMLIINDIDILQSNAEKINYLSRNVEANQSSHNQAILHTINTFPTTTNKSIPVGRSSLSNIRESVTKNQSITDSIESETHISISQINQYSNKWYIKGIVTNKTNIHHYNNARGEGTVFSFDFLDDTDEIRVTVFNNDCNRFYSTINTGTTYHIAKAIVKPVNRQYNKLSSNYEIYVTQDTIINYCSTDTLLHAPTIRYNFVQLCDVQNQRTNSVIDVIGIVDVVLDPAVVTNNIDQKSYIKRTIHMIDETGSIPVTLWQDQATNFNDNNNSVLAFEGIKVHDYNGCRSLSTTPTTYLKYNPIDTERTEKLKQWFKHYSKNPTKHINSSIIETCVQQSYNIPHSIIIIFPYLF